MPVAKIRALEQRTQAVSASMSAVYIFCYHAVVDEPLPIRDWCFLDSSSFRWQMEQLRARFEIVSLSEAARLISTNTVDRPLAVVTFDDGFLNFYQCAFPILKELSIPSTVFVATGFVDSDETPWFCRLHKAITETSISDLLWRGERLDLRTPSSRALASQRLQQDLKALEHVSLLGELQRVIITLGCNPDEPIPSTSPYRMLSSEHLRELQRSGLVELGAHTVSHTILSKLGREQRKSEIRRSIEAIEGITAAPCTLFAYPNGELDDYGEQDIRTAFECGITTAVSSHAGVAVNGSSVMELRRLPIGSNISNREFVALFGYHDVVSAQAGFSLGEMDLQPSHIRLDAASACQLRCPCCVQERRSDNYNVADGWLSFEKFKTMVDRNPWVSSMEISNWGEIFVNPELVEILRYAYENGVSLSASNGVNLNQATDAMIEALVKYQLSVMTCSIDGASDEVYKKYRVRGNLNRVLKNIERINYYKDLYQSEYPRLTWQFVVFGHNQHEIEQARKLARRYDMKFKPKLSWDPGYSPPKADDIIAKEFGEGVASVTDYKEVNDQEYLQETMCSQLWVEPVVNWDGMVFGCCANYWQPFEKNAFTDGLSEAINSPKMKYARAMLTGDKPPMEDIPCTTCRQYKTMQATGNYMEAPRVPAQQRTPASLAGVLSEATAPDTSFVWWRRVWRHYIAGDYEDGRAGLELFADQGVDFLVTSAKNALLDTAIDEMHTVIDSFSRDADQVFGLGVQRGELTVSLYLTAFGQAALRGENANARRSLYSAVLGSKHPRTIRAWMNFFHAAILHARQKRRLKSGQQPLL
jgi:peptidoglycan/xylan/chitin deacetylase (PgdA/CDA1 family)